MAAPHEMTLALLALRETIIQAERLQNSAEATIAKLLGVPKDHLTGMEDEILSFVHADLSPRAAVDRLWEQAQQELRPVSDFPGAEGG